MMNRRGNIAFILLPVVALMACTLGIFSYIALDDNFGSQSSDIAKMSSEVNVMEQYIDASASLMIEDFIKGGFTPETLRQSAFNRDMHIEGEGNFFSKVENGEFKVYRDGSSVILEVEGVFIQSREGENLWKREWTVATEAGINGEFIRFINK